MMTRNLISVSLALLPVWVLACGDDANQLGNAGSGGRGAGAGGAMAAGGTDQGGDATSTAGTGAAGGGGNTTGAGGGATSLPLGNVAGLATQPCAAGAAPGAVCQQGTVSCPGIEDISFQLAVAEPAGAATGTVFMMFGGEGTQYFEGGFGAEAFDERYLQAGFRVVQVFFQTAWEASSAGSVKLAACRVATITQWAFDNPHAGSTDTGFCAHGHSGGSGSMGYAMAHYNLETILDYVMFDAGPVFSRMDYGCEPPLSPNPSGTRFVCDDLSDGLFAYGGASSKINSWEDTTTCGAPYGDASPAELQAWQQDSIISAGADYSYPQTDVSFWFCANNDSNEAAGQGSFFAEEVLSQKSVNCVMGTCSTEPAWTDQQGFNDMASTMTTGCIPRHQQQ